MIEYTVEKKNKKTGAPRQDILQYSLQYDSL